MSLDIGQKIKKLRELKNLTQEHFAKELDMTQSAYSKIEKGETDISYSKLQKIAEALQLRPEDILSFNEQIVFNVMNNKVGNGLVINHVTGEAKNLYESQINSLKEEISHLKSVLEKVLAK